MSRDRTRGWPRLIAWLLLLTALTVAPAVPATAQPGVPVPDAQPTDTPDTGTGEDGGDTCGQVPGLPTEVADLCGIGGSVQLPVPGSGGLLDSAVQAFWRQLVEWFASGLRLLLDGLVHAARVTTRIDLEADWFVARFTEVLQVGGTLMLPLFLAAMIRGLLVDRAELGRAVMMLPAAALVTVIALPAAQLFIVTIDKLSAGYQSTLGTSVEEFVTLLGAAAAPLAAPATAASSGATVPAGAFGFVLIGLFLTFTAFVVWLELVLRQAGVYLLALFLPLAFAGLVWTPTRGWLARMAQAFAALVVSKFVIVVILSTATAALNAMAADWVGGGEAADIGRGTVLEQLSLLALGVALLGLAAFAPYTVWRLIPMAGATANGVFEGVLRRGTAGVGRPHPVQTTYNHVARYDHARTIMSRAGSGSRGAASIARPPTGGAASGAGARAAGGTVAAPVAAAATVAAAAQKGSKTVAQAAHRFGTQTQAS